MSVGVSFQHKNFYELIQTIIVTLLPSHIFVFLRVHLKTSLSESISDVIQQDLFLIFPYLYVLHMYEFAYTHAYVPHRRMVPEIRKE